jgi:hypothetical protein
VVRQGLTFAGQPAVLASVEPSLTGDGWGAGTSQALLVSRTRGVSIDEMVGDERQRPARLHVCRYLGASAQIPSEVPRSDVSLEFWGRST